MSILIRYCRERLVFHRVRGKFEPVCNDRCGTTSIEYAMIVLFIGLVLIGLQSSIGNSVVGFFMSAANGL